MKRIVTYIVFLFLPAIAAQAQYVYRCDFETDSVRQLWTLNPGANPALIARAENKWTFGGDAANHGADGHYGLMVSSDGINPVYTNAKPNIMLAYSSVELNPGNYTLTFDWIGNTVSMGGEGLYVSIVPDSDTDVKLNSGASVMYDWAKPTSEYSVVKTALGSATTWKQHRAEITIPQAQQTNKYKIVLVWNQAGTNKCDPSSICIDNICILDKNLKCDAPSKIETKVTSTGLQITWAGIADSYDLMLYDEASRTWKSVTDYTQKHYTLNDIEEGVQNIYIRSHCGDLVSEYVFIQPFYYQRGIRCIDYMALDDAKSSTCYEGSYDNQREHTVKMTYEDLLHGSEYNDNNLFSIHYIDNEFDPYTDNKLPTKPKGNIASVRLGRFNNAFGACAEYKYKVPEGDKAVLMLRYAVVLPNPHPDNENANPKFHLEILADGQKLDYGCGEADFMSGSTIVDDGTWHIVGQGSNSIYWKEWTDVAINLRDYVGQTITIRLMTTGCAYSAHGGYAYYTLECVNSTLSGINCGDVPTTEFIAPEGFNYHWYLPEKPDSILPNNNERTFKVDPMDTLTYNVDIISKTNAHCYYTLDATAVPRFPVPQATYVRDEENICGNTVRFTQTSHVMYKNQITDREWHTDLPVEFLSWDFGDGTALVETLDEVVEHEFPREGGTFTVTLSASISDNLCVVPLTINVVLPDVSQKEVVVHADVCEGDSYQYGGVYYFNTYVDTLHFTSSQGCDSTVYMDIQFHPINYEVSDSICEGTQYHFGNQVLTTSGVYTSKGTSIYGCDSIVKLTLKVIPVVKVRFDDTVYVCSDERRVLEIPYELLQGELEQITIRFDAAAQAVGLAAEYNFGPEEPIVIQIPDDVDPTRLHATIAYGTPNCAVPDKDLCVEVRYGASFLYQQEGLLSVKNSDVNGGYNFYGYQWYQNGERLEGHNEPYLSVLGGKTGDEYYVELTDSNGVVLASCPLRYDPMALETVYSAQYPCRAYTVLGHWVGEIISNDDFYALPHGVYILSNENETYKVVR